MNWLHTCGKCGKEYDDNEIGPITFCPNCAKQMDKYKIRSPTEHYCLLYAVTPNRNAGQ